MHHKVWSALNAVGLLIVGILTWIILTRRVDGAGHVETSSSRMLALGVLGVFVGAVVIVELIALFLVRRQEKRQG